MALAGRRHGHVHVHEPPTPTLAGLQLSKRTLGGVGSFRFAIAGPDRGTQTIATTVPRVARRRCAARGLARAYTVTERLPARTRGCSWRPVKVTCAGKAFDPLEPVRFTVDAGGGVACEFTNEFIPAGKLQLRKVTRGGIGTAFFQISPRGANAQPLLQGRKVRRQLVPVHGHGRRHDRAAARRLRHPRVRTAGDVGGHLASGVGAV